MVCEVDQTPDWERSTSDIKWLIREEEARVDRHSRHLMLLTEQVNSHINRLKELKAVLEERETVNIRHSELMKELLYY